MSGLDCAKEELFLAWVFLSIQITNQDFKRYSLLRWFLISLKQVDIKFYILKPNFMQLKKDSKIAGRMEKLKTVQMYTTLNIVQFGPYVACDYYRILTVNSWGI